MNQPLVSVLIANYNHEDTITETLQSVLNQTYKNMQIIVIDDGSTDESWNLINQFDDSRIEAFGLEKNKHVCAATNYGMTKIKGDYVARTDSDDIWYPNKIERQIQYMTMHKDCKVCFTWCDFIDENGVNINDVETNRVRLHEASFSSQEDAIERFYFRGNCLAHSSVVMETEVMNTVGVYDVGYNQLHDFDYWIRIAKRYPIDVIKEKCMAVRRFLNQENRETNMSNMSESTETRVFNEYMELRAHYFEDMSDELFIKAFGKYFRKKGQLNPEQLECEKAFLMCRPQDGWNGIPPAGLGRIHELLMNNKTKKILEDDYNLGIKDYYKLLGNHLYNDSLLQTKSRNMQEENKYLIEKRNNLINEHEKLYEKIQILQEEKNDLINEIELYENSTSWKMTKPLRTLGRKLKRK